jgi:hypothetical protein
VCSNLIFDNIIGTGRVKTVSHASEEDDVSRAQGNMSIARNDGGRDSAEEINERGKKRSEVDGAKGETCNSCAFDRLTFGTFARELHCEDATNVRIW